MEGLPEALLGEIVKWITDTNDHSSLTLVSKLLYTVEAQHRSSIRIGCPLCPSTLAMASLRTRFPNLSKVEINYSGWTTNNEMQLDNQGLHVLSACCHSLADLTSSFCLFIDDSGLCYLAGCKKLKPLMLNSVPAISSTGLLRVAVGCKSLSCLHLIGLKKVGSVEWLEYLGREGVLEELLVVDCKGISQFDLLKFGSGWMKLHRFQLENKGTFEMDQPEVISHIHYKYDFYCQSLKVLTLAHIVIVPDMGLILL